MSSRRGPYGRALLTDALRNKGVAFTREERERHGLVGALPPGVLSLDQQTRRAWEQVQAQPDDLAKNVCLEQLHDRNEVLYHRLLTEHLTELLPKTEPLRAPGGDRALCVPGRCRRPRGPA